jgi:uncharacterized protein
MSHENVEAVRATYDAFNQRDFDALFEFYDPEIVWEQDEGFLEPGTHHGHAGVRHVFESLFESFEEFHIYVERLFDLGDQVLSLIRLVGSGRGSGLEVQNRGAHLWSLRDGKAVKLKMFSDPAQALDTVGLSDHARPE